MDKISPNTFKIVADELSCRWGKEVDEGSLSVESINTESKTLVLNFDNFKSMVKVLIPYHIKDNEIYLNKNELENQIKVYEFAANLFEVAAAELNRRWGRTERDESRVKPAHLKLSAVNEQSGQLILNYNQGMEHTKAVMPYSVGDFTHEIYLSADNLKDDAKEQSLVQSELTKAETVTQPKAVKNKSKKSKIAVAIVKIVLIIGGGIGFLKAYDSNLFNPELNNPIYSELESEEFQKALNEFKFSGVDINNSSSVTKYVEQMGKKIKQILVNSGAQVAQKAYITDLWIDGNILSIRLSIVGSSLHSTLQFSISDTLLRDFNKIIESNDGNVQIKLLAAIRQVVKNGNLQKVSNYQYDNGRLKSQFYKRLENSINELLEDNQKPLVDCYKSNNLYPIDVNEQEGTIILLYNDENYLAVFPIDCLGRKGSHGGIIVNSTNFSKEFFDETAQSFLDVVKNNENINLTKYFNAEMLMQLLDSLESGTSIDN